MIVAGIERTQGADHLSDSISWPYACPSADHVSRHAILIN